MAELFTQKDKQPELFQTEDDIAAELQTQFGTPSTGKDLLLDTESEGTDKNQSSRLDSESDELSGMEKADDSTNDQKSYMIFQKVTRILSQAQIHRAPAALAPIMICCAASTRTVAIKLQHTGL